MLVVMIEIIPFRWQKHREHVVSWNAFVCRARRIRSLYWLLVEAKLSTW